MTKRKRHAPVWLGPFIFFLLFCFLGALAGVWINNRYYEIRANYLNPPKPPETNEGPRETAL